jgi:hypothetical protein
MRAVDFYIIKNHQTKYPKFRKINNKNVIVQKLWVMEKILIAYLNSA